ncbi:MAG TPA: MFS transporter [Conexibacter sp.]|nr:MFS transporter [Conexibacter sp.]
MSSYRALLARPGARAVALACGLGWLSFSSYALALVLAVEAASGSFATAGATVAAFAAGSALLAPLRGRVVDRRGPRALATFAIPHAAALLGLVALCAGAVGGGSSLEGSAQGAERAAMWPLLVCAALAGATAPPLIATARSLWPRVAGAELARSGHALNAALGDAAQVAGPALTGALAALAVPLVALAALIPGVVAGALLLARAAPRAAAPASSRAAAPVAIATRAAESLVPPRYETLRCSTRARGLRANRALRTLVVCEIALGLWLGALEVAAPALAAADGGAAARGALPLALFATASVVASLWSGRTGGRTHRRERDAAPPRERRRARRRLPRDAPTRYLAASLALALILPLCLLAPSLGGLTVTAAAAGTAFGVLNVALFELLDRLVAPARAIEAFTWLTSGQGAGLALGAAGAGQLARGDATGALLLVALPPALAAALAIARRATLRPLPAADA